MSTITITSFQIKNSQLADGTCYLRIRANNDFITSDGVEILASGLYSADFYKSVTCTISSGVITASSFTVDSTTDSISYPRASFRFDLFNTNGDLIETAHKKIQVSHLTTPITWGALVAENSGSRSAASVVLASISYVNGAISALVSMATKATDAIYGAVKVDVPADDVSIPIVVGVNSPRLTKVVAAGGDYATLEAAISAISSTATTLIVKENQTVANNVATDANTVVRFENNAVISVNDTKTLTINRMENPGNVQCFDGLGTVVVAPRAVEYFNTVWWTGTDTSLDHAIAFQRCFANVSTNDGGTVYTPEGVWKAGEIDLPSNTVWRGAGKGRDGIKGTTIELANEDAFDYVLKASEAFRHIVLEDMSLSSAAFTIKSILVLEGTSPNTANGFTCNRVMFHGTGVGSPAQVLINDLLNDWEMIGVSLNDCTWLVPEGGIGIQSTTINTGIELRAPFFYLQEDAWAGVFDSVANLNITNPTINGAGSAVAKETLNRTITAGGSITTGTANLTVTTALSRNDIGQKVVITGKVNSGLNARILSIGSDGLTAVLSTNATATATTENTGIYYFTPSDSIAAGAFKFGGAHGNVTITNSQDEGIGYFLQVDGSQQTHPFTLLGCTVQSAILLNQSCTLAIEGGNYFSNCIRDAAAASAYVFVQGAHVDRVTVDTDLVGVAGVQLAEPKLFGDHQGASILVTEFTAMSNVLRQRMNMPLDIRHGAEFAGNPDLTNPVASIGSSYDKVLLALGKMNAITRELEHFYKFSRSNTTGHLELAGTQDGFRGWTVSGVSSRKTLITLAYSATIPMSARYADRYVLTPTGDCTINVTDGTEGQKITLKVIEDGSARIVTFGTGFKKSGTLTTGTTVGNLWTVSFEHDGTNFVQVGTILGPLT